MQNKNKMNFQGSKSFCFASLKLSNTDADVYIFMNVSHTVSRSVFSSIPMNDAYKISCDCVYFPQENKLTSKTVM